MSPQNQPSSKIRLLDLQLCVTVTHWSCCCQFHLQGATEMLTKQLQQHSDLNLRFFSEFFWYDHDKSLVSGPLLKAIT